MTMCYTPPTMVCLFYYISNDHISTTNMVSCAMVVDLCFPTVVHPQKLSRKFTTLNQAILVQHKMLYLSMHFPMLVDTTFEYHTLWGGWGISHLIITVPECHLVAKFAHFILISFSYSCHLCYSSTIKLRPCLRFKADLHHTVMLFASCQHMPMMDTSV